MGRLWLLWPASRGRKLPQIIGVPPEPPPTRRTSPPSQPPRAGWRARERRIRPQVSSAGRAQHKALAAHRRDARTLPPAPRAAPPTRRRRAALNQPRPRRRTSNTCSRARPQAGCNLPGRPGPARAGQAPGQPLVAYFKRAQGPFNSAPPPKTATTKLTPISRPACRRRGRRLSLMT